MAEDRSKETLNIYKGDDKIGSGKSPVHVKLDDGDYPAGTFQGTFADADGNESDKADFPAVTITAQADKDKTDGGTAGKADGDAGKDAADNSKKSKAYQDAYTAAYTPAKAAYDGAFADGKKDGDAGKPAISNSGHSDTYMNAYMAGYTPAKAAYDAAHPATVAVTGVTVDHDTLAVGVGKTGQITPTVAPDNATNKAVKYDSSDTSIATVDKNGLVTGVKAGKAKVTTTTDDGGKTATTEVTVS